MLGQYLSTSLSKSPRNRYVPSVPSFPSVLQNSGTSCYVGVRVSGRGGACITVMLRRQCWNILAILTTSGPGTRTDPGQAASHWSRCPGPCPPPGPPTAGWSCLPPTPGLYPVLVKRLDNWSHLCRHYSHTMGRLKSDKDDNYTYPWVFFDPTTQQKNKMLHSQARYKKENVNVVWEDSLELFIQLNVIDILYNIPRSNWYK